MNIHHNLDLTEKVALQKAKDHNRVYHIILMNPNSDGEFDIEAGSTYEIVSDSFQNSEDADDANFIAITDTNEIKFRSEQ